MKTQTNKNYFKSLIVALLTVAAVGSMSSAYAQTGINDPGMQPGYGNSDGDPATVWCNNIVEQLERSLNFAQMQESRGQFQEAASTLVNGLAQANSSVSARKGPMTARAIARGLQLSSVIRNSMGGQPNAVRSVVLFVSQYYQFIIDVATQLDIPYYIPYNGCRQCGGQGSIQDFEQNFITFAKREVQIVLDTLVVSSGYGVVPVGSTSAFVNVLAHSAQYAANDLRESPFVAQYACTVR